jgi:hypothetical protein
MDTTPSVVPLSSSSLPSSKYPLNDKWKLYYHLPQNSNWDLSSYTVILGDIDNVETVIALNENIGENINMVYLNSIFFIYDYI